MFNTLMTIRFFYFGQNQKNRFLYHRQNRLSFEPDVTAYLEKTSCLMIMTDSTEFVCRQVTWLSSPPSTANIAPVVHGASLTR